MSEYGDAPIDKIDWDARAVRLLIESVCKVPAYPCRFVVTTRRRQPQRDRTTLCGIEARPSVPPYQSLIRIPNRESTAGAAPSAAP